MSNVLKSMNYVSTNTDKRVIDYNELISRKLQKIQEELKDKSHNLQEEAFTPGLSAERAEELLGEEKESAAAAEELANDLIANAKSEAERIVSIAESDAESILKKAAEEKMQIMQSAYKDGFEKGHREAADQCRREYEEKQAELDKRRTELEEEVRQQKQEMEPVLVDTILEVFENVTHLLLEDKKDLILEVVNSAFEDIDVSRNYLIKACHEDAVFLKENKDKIIAASGDSSIEIVEDQTMKKGQCIIDTDFGIVDCSLDMQIQELVKDIKILSCMGRDAK